MRCAWTLQILYHFYIRDFKKIYGLLVLGYKKARAAQRAEKHTSHAEVLTME